MADLQGRVVAFLEARRATELASLIQRHHGTPLAVPCLQATYRPDAPELATAIERLCSDQVQVAVFLTGVGAGIILEAARRLGREQALADALAVKRVAARGPKPVTVLRQAGVRVDVVAPAPHTSQELLAAMESWNLQDKLVAVQLAGGPNPALRQALEARGARVLEIQPYAWERPSDPTPVLRLIEELSAGRVGVLAATSAGQVNNLFAIAREHHREEPLRQALRQIPVAAQGPVCAAAFEREGVAVSITPAHGHMGALVLAIARFFDASTQTRQGRAMPLPLQG